MNIRLPVKYFTPIYGLYYNLIMERAVENSNLSPEEVKEKVVPMDNVVREIRYHLIEKGYNYDETYFNNIVDKVKLLIEVTGEEIRKNILAPILEGRRPDIILLNQDIEIDSEILQYLTEICEENKKTMKLVIEIINEGADLNLDWQTFFDDIRKLIKASLN